MCRLAAAPSKGDFDSGTRAVLLRQCQMRTLSLHETAPLVVLLWSA